MRKPYERDTPKRLCGSLTNYSSMRKPYARARLGAGVSGRHAQNGGDFHGRRALALPRFDRRGLLLRCLNPQPQTLNPEL